MVHGMFYAVLLLVFLVSLVAQWLFREYFEFSLCLYSVEILFIGVLSWYGFGSLVFLPLLGLWLAGTGIIFMMHRLA